MTSFTKIIFQLLPLGIVLLIAALYHSLNYYKYIVEESTVELQISRHRRAINLTAVRHYCKLNQYYDQEEGRCLGIPGGGKMLHVENGRSCGINILKPHCTSSLYYHICKRNKSILAQCANRQIFDNRLQRCAYYDSSRLTPNTIRPDDYEHINVSIAVPNCTKLGQFPVPDHCFMFYTCNTNGHRFHQNVFKCPRNTGYQANKGVCAIVPDCENNDSVDSAICVPDAPGENVESLNSEEDTEENVEETTEVSKESEIKNINSALKREENINSRMYDDIISTTSDSIIGNSLSVDNYTENDGDFYKTSSLPTQPIQDISISDSADEKSMLNQALNSTENTREVQNEKDDSISPFDLQITSPSMIEVDDNAQHFIMSQTPMYSTDINSNVESGIVNTTPFSTVSYTSLILDEKTQDITTEQYRNNGDRTLTLLNSNTETLDPYSPSTISNIPEFSSISETSSQLYEEMQSATTEHYGNDDRIMTPPNFNTEMVDQNPVPILSNIATDGPRVDFDTSTSASASLPQTEINDNQYAKELFKTSPSIDSKLVDSNLDASEAIESVSTRYSSEHTDTLDLASTTKSTLTLEHITASMDITTITPIIQDLPAISDTDLITQNDKDSVEASSFIEQSTPITNN